MGLLNLDYEKLMTNPMLQSGLGILANNKGHYGQFAPAFGGGMMQGMQNAQSFTQAQQESLLRKQQMEQQKINADLQQKQFSLQNDKFLQEKQSFDRTNAALDRFKLNNPTLSDVVDIDPQSAVKLITGKQKKLAFTPNGLPYDENNPELDMSKSYAKADSASNSSLAKMMSEMNALPQGSPARAIYQKAINKEINFAPPMVVQNYPAPTAAINPLTGQQELIQFGNKGDVRPTGFKPVGTTKSATEGQAKAATFYSQMNSASNELDKLTAEGYDPSTLGSQIETSMASGLGNNFVSPTSQQARQAQNQWAESFLRVKTGAAATKDEVTMNVETFFPKPGDSAKVIEQKSRMRKQAENDVAKMTQDPNAILSKGSKMPEKPRSKAEILKQYGVR